MLGRAPCERDRLGERFMFLNETLEVVLDFVLNGIR